MQNSGKRQREAPLPDIHPSKVAGSFPRSLGWVLVAPRLLGGCGSCISPQVISAAAASRAGFESAGACRQLEGCQPGETRLEKRAKQLFATRSLPAAAGDVLQPLQRLVAGSAAAAPSEADPGTGCLASAKANRPVLEHLLGSGSLESFLLPLPAWTSCTVLAAVAQDHLLPAALWSFVGNGDAEARQIPNVERGLSASPQPHSLRLLADAWVLQGLF